MDSVNESNQKGYLSSKLTFLRIFVRLLFVQGLFNRKGMQNLGFANAIIAADDGNEELLKKHMGFFNCNPNFTPLVVGGVLKLEEEKRNGKPVDDKDIEYFKRSISSPLAAIGDMLFLGSLKPLALTFACIFAIYNSVMGLLAVFLLYNLIILSCRFWGVYFGYSKGWELVEVFSSPVFQLALNIVQGVGASVGGALIAILVYRFRPEGPWVSISGGILAISTILLIRKDVSATWLAICLFIISIALSLLII